MSKTNEFQGSNAEEKYKGVGGWLLFFCVGLTILSPLRGAFALIQGYNQSNPYFDRFPGLRTLTMIDMPVSIALMGFSIYAGVGLWSIRPGAVRTAKRFLIVTLVYLVVSSFFLPFIVELPERATSAMLPEIVKGFFQGLVFVVIWLMYLNKSRRVKATYPDAA